MMLLAVAIGSGVVLLFVIGRYRYAGLDVDWQVLVTPAGRRALNELRSRFALERPAIEIAIGRPREIADEGDEAEAARLLVAGYEYMASLAVDREQLLHSMARYSRMVTALMPLPPIAADHFHLRRLSTLAGLAAIVHHLLVTVPERFRLRLAVLRAGFKIVLRALLRAGGPGETPRWQIAVDALADWHTLDVETLESFRALVTAVTLPEIEAAKAARRA